MGNESLVYDYLVLNYSPRRIKINQKGQSKFKSTYLLNGIAYYASNKGDMLNLAINLNKLVTIVFHDEKDSHSKMINKFLRIF